MDCNKLFELAFNVPSVMRGHSPDTASTSSATPLTRLTAPPTQHPAIRPRGRVNSLTKHSLHQPALTPMYCPSTNSWGTLISSDCIRSLISCWNSVLMNTSRSSNLTRSVRRICLTFEHFAYVSRTMPIVVE